MFEGISYADWEKLANSKDDVNRSQSVYVHVMLYDAQGRPSVIRGEMVKAKVASGMFFPDPPSEPVDDEEELLPFPVKSEEPEPVATGPKPKFPNFSKRIRKRE